MGTLLTYHFLVLLDACGVWTQLRVLGSIVGWLTAAWVSWLKDELCWLVGPQQQLVRGFRGGSACDRCSISITYSVAV